MEIYESPDIYLPMVAMQAPKSISSRPIPRALQAYHKHRVVTLPLTTYSI